MGLTSACRQPTLTIALVVAVASCVEEGSLVTAAPQVRDSAGVRIVESPAPIWQAGEAWSASRSPLTTIGSSDGAPEYTLYGVASALRHPTGEIVVVNGGTSELRFYGADGRYLRSAGTSGDGPGEFRGLRDAWLYRGDSILTSDTRLGRLTVFDAVGRLGRTVSIARRDGIAQVIGAPPFDDGTLLVAGIVQPSERPRPGLFDGGGRAFDRHEADGVLRNEIGYQARGPYWGFEYGGGPAYTVAPFSVSRPPVASDGSSVFFGAGTDASIGRWNAEGRLIGRIRWTASERAVTSETIDRFEAGRLGSDATDEGVAITRAMLAGLEYPEMLPEYESLLVDADGYVWVRRYREEWEDSYRWWIFDPDGRWLGEPSVPGSLDIREVGRDYLLGIRTDELGVERVELYGLSR